MTRKPNSLWPRFLKLGALVLCLFPLAGCWTTAKEVIPISDGVPIPYTTYLTKLADGHFVYLSRLPGSNDYSYRFDPAYTQDTCSSSDYIIRAIHLRGDIYVIQEQCKGSTVYDILFYRITSETYNEVEPDLVLDVFEARAARYNVELTDIGTLSGDPSRILRFLKDLTDISFKDGDPSARGAHS